MISVKLRKNLEKSLVNQGSRFLIIMLVLSGNTHERLKKMIVQGMLCPAVIFFAVIYEFI
jgi:hypothetical protein